MGRRASSYLGRTGRNRDPSGVSKPRRSSIARSRVLNEKSFGERRSLPEAHEKFPQQPIGNPPRHLGHRKQTPRHTGKLSVGSLWPDPCRRGRSCSRPQRETTEPARRSRVTMNEDAAAQRHPAGMRRRILARNFEELPGVGLVRPRGAAASRRAVRPRPPLRLAAARGVTGGDGVQDPLAGQVLGGNSKAASNAPFL